MNDLDILSTGIHLPPSLEVAEAAKAAGADTEGYRGWRRVCRARDDEHPSSMGADALSSALDAARVAAVDLSLVISAGVSRDFPPSWSVATEIMALCGTSARCLGVDITIGCLGSLTALEFARGWLESHGGGVAAIVVAERWSYTVDLSSRASMSLWAHGDAAAALLVSAGRASRRPIARFRGAEFSSDSGLNGRILIPYGGTRQPVGPPDAAPYRRQLSGHSRKEISVRYQAGYQRAFDALKSRFGQQPDRLICNQITPGFVPILADIARVPRNRAVVTGDDYGHLGSVDVIVGLSTLLGGRQLDGTVATAASTAYAFGAALFVSPD